MALSEKQKMMAGEYYNSRDPELLGMYHRARRLTAAFNDTPSDHPDRKTSLLSELMAHKGEGVWIEAPFFCEYGAHLSIGDHTFVNMNCIFLDCHHIRIGKNGLIAPAVQIYTAYHPLAAGQRIRSDRQKGDGMAVYRTQAAPVNIGDNVWIGGNTVIFPGVSIGDNTTVGAGSVVTRDIPANVLAYGNPCRVIRGL